MNKKNKSKSKKKDNSGLVIQEDNDTLVNKDEDDEDDVVKVESHSNKFKSISGDNKVHDKANDKSIEDNQKPAPKEGGLKSAKQVQLDNKLLREQEAREFTLDNEELNRNNQTIHRDSSGKVVDLENEEKQKQQKHQEQERKKAHWGKGLVQRGLVRDIDSQNDDIRNVERWNDPGNQFIGTKSKKQSNKPQYKGPQPPPNRFNIPPGFRWDGVDRSNGFESKLFGSINNKNIKVYQHNKWSAEDM